MTRCARLVLACALGWIGGARAAARAGAEVPREPSPWPIAYADPETPPTPDDRLALEDAVWLALRRNGDLQSRRLEPMVAGSFLLRAQSAFDSGLFAAVEVGEEEASEISRSSGEQFDVSAERRASEVGIRRDFSTGTGVELALREDRDASNRAPEQQEVRAEATLTQALLRGRRPAANLAEVRQAELGIEVSRQELRGYVQALVAETETAFWQYHLALETIAITEQALAVAEQQLEETRTRISVGQLARNEEAAALAEAARRRQALIEARAESETRRLDLLALIAPGVYEAECLPASPVRVPAAPLDDLPARLALADRLRPDLEEARLRAEQGRLEVVRTRDGLLPRLDFFATLAKTGFGGSLDEAVNAFPEDTYEWQVGLRFLHELGTRRARADDLDARTRNTQAALAVDNLQRLIGTEVRQAATEAERARQQIDASAETRRLQEETLRAEQERFAVGASTSLLVAQAQRDLLASRIVEQRVLVQYRIALIQLEVAEGSLLERRGINVE